MPVCGAQFWDREECALGAAENSGRSWHVLLSWMREAYELGVGEGIFLKKSLRYVKCANGGGCGF